MSSKLGQGTDSSWKDETCTGMSAIKTCTTNNYLLFSEYNGTNKLMWNYTTESETKQLEMNDPVKFCTLFCLSVRNILQTFDLKPTS